MLVVKPSSIGMDAVIEDLQTYMYSNLTPIWGTNDLSWDCYGRAYRNQTQDGYTPEVFVGGKEYKEVYFDDRLSVLSFFGVSEVVDMSLVTRNTVDAWCIFMVNLPLIKPGITRNDEEVHADVERQMRKWYNGDIITGMVTGISKVFFEYSGWLVTEGIKFRDMHPLHCFRVNFKLYYDLNNSC